MHTFILLGDIHVKFSWPQLYRGSCVFTEGLCTSQYIFIGQYSRVRTISCQKARMPLWHLLWWFQGWGPRQRRESDLQEGDRIGHTHRTYTSWLNISLPSQRDILAWRCWRFCEHRCVGWGSGLTARVFLLAGWCCGPVDFDLLWDGDGGGETQTTGQVG